MLNSRVRSLVIGVIATLLLTAVSAGAADNVTQDVKVAVLPFTVNAGDDLSYLQESLPELLTDRLREAGFEVVDPAEVKRLVDEKGYSSFNTKSARELALLSGAGFSVYGSLNQIGDNLTLDSRLVDAYGTNPGKKMSVTKEGLINLLPAVDDLVDRMKMDLLRLDIIAEVDVEGTKVLDKDVVLMRLTLQKGDMLTAKAVNTALKNIYDLGYFDDVEVKVETIPDGKRVVFAVVEKPRIQALGVRGADEIDSEDILESISTKKGGVVNPKVLSDDIRVIREMYRKEGYYKAKVTHEIEGAGTGIARLTFVIDEGPKLYIQNVIIDGAKQLDPDDIKEVLALKERGITSWFTNSGVLKEELLERDASAVMAYYQSKGFIDAKVGQPEIEITDDGIDVIYKVWEGDRYKMGETLFKGDLIDDPSKLMTVTAVDKLKEDDEYFDRTLLKNDIEMLTNYYNNYGYAYADVQVNLKDDPETKIVDVVYSISKHQRVHIRRVLIEGNTATRDNVIMRDMRLADGDMFSGDKLNRSYQRLNNLGYFEKVDISPVPTGNPDEMDLVVKVKDKPTGKISGGVGYSTYDSVYFAGEVSERNLFGKGYYLGLNGQFSGRKTAFVLNFRNPHLNDSDLGLGVGAHHNSEDFDEYTKDSTGSNVNFFYPVGEYTSVSWNYGAEYYVIRDISSTASNSTKDDKGSHFASILSGTITRNTVDNYARPTSGSITSLSMIVGGGPLGGTDDFVKYLGAWDYYTPIFEEVVFHSKVWGGFVHQNFGSNHIPTAQRFKLGGIDNVRGYSNYVITALENNENNATIGGNKAMYFNFELKRPINKEYGINGLLFVDAGNVWKENEMFFEAVERYGTAPALGLYKSAGGGVTWNSPMGPVGFVYGYGMDKINNKGGHKFELLMGKQF